MRVREKRSRVEWMKKRVNRKGTELWGKKPSGYCGY